MLVTLGRPHELGAAEVEAWRRFQRQTTSLASPFLGPELAAAMSRHRPNVFVATLHDGPELVGFFPFERHRLGLGRALGYGATDYQGVIHAPGFEWHGPDLLAACNLSVWEFDHLVVDQVPRFGPQVIEHRASPTIDLRNGWEAWQEERRKASSSRMKKARQYERKLGNEVGEVRFELDSRRPEHLDLLMRWKSDQYVRTGRRDRFEQPWLVETVRELFDRRDAGFFCLLSTMYVGDQPAALYLALRSHDVLAGWFPAYDIELARLSPGLVHLHNLARLAADDGVRLFDLGAGEADYKETFKSFDATVARGELRRPTAAAALRRMQTTPRRVVTDFVLSRPRLRVAARQTLNRMGDLRSRARRRA